MEKIIKKIIYKSIKFYQRILSLDQGILNPFKQRKICRFYPSCSEYFYQSVKKYGARIGAWRGLKRIIKCHPWNAGGVDMP